MYFPFNTFKLSFNFKFFSSSYCNSFSFLKTLCSSSLFFDSFSFLSKMSSFWFTDFYFSISDCSVAFPVLIVSAFSKINFYLVFIWFKSKFKDFFISFYLDVIFFIDSASRAIIFCLHVDRICSSFDLIFYYFLSRIFCFFCS